MEEQPAKSTRKHSDGRNLFRTEPLHAALAAFLAGSACGNTECAHRSAASATLPTVDGTLGRTHIGGSRIKRRLHTGLPRTADRSRIKWRPRAERGHASGSLARQRQ
ncbi:hypothetical protein B296_00008324 [Ensete ventricosum]|uniref:Uncharacterized protein n=1 Tax=Ensete ventricosum TaxID=4639 RepID=A0A426ZUA4_ENSVE|nr:hypothetical protein B296_00008324 [Ensete ventricosum]